jgi:hypothetical protein
MQQSVISTDPSPAVMPVLATIGLARKTFRLRAEQFSFTGGGSFLEMARGQNRFPRRSRNLRSSDQQSRRSVLAWFPTKISLLDFSQL